MKQMLIKYIMLIVFAVSVITMVVSSFLEGTQIKNKKLCNKICTASSIVAYIAIFVLVFGVMLPNIGHKW